MNAVKIVVGGAVGNLRLSRLCFGVFLDVPLRGPVVECVSVLQLCILTLSYQLPEVGLPSRRRIVVLSQVSTSARQHGIAIGRDRLPVLRCLLQRRQRLAANVEVVDNVYMTTLHVLKCVSRTN